MKTELLNFWTTHWTLRAGLVLVLTCCLSACGGGDEEAGDAFRQELLEADTVSSRDGGGFDFSEADAKKYKAEAEKRELDLISEILLNRGDSEYTHELIFLLMADHDKALIEAVKSGTIVTYDDETKMIKAWLSTASKASSDKAYEYELSAAIDRQER